MNIELKVEVEHVKFLVDNFVAFLIDVRVEEFDALPYFQRFVLATNVMELTLCSLIPKCVGCKLTYIIEPK